MLLMHHTNPGGPNYRLRVANVGFRAAKRDYGDLFYLVEPVKFPQVSQRFPLSRVVLNVDLHFAGLMLCKRRKFGMVYN